MSARFWSRESNARQRKWTCSRQDTAYDFHALEEDGAPRNYDAVDAVVLENREIRVLYTDSSEGCEAARLAAVCF